MMQRRSFIQAGLAAGVATGAAAFLPGRAQAAPEANLRLFEVTTTVDLAEKAEAAHLWVPLFQTVGTYQKLIGLRWEGDGAVAVDRDPQFGAQMLHARWAKGDGQRRLNLVQRVATWERSKEDAAFAVTAADRAFWTKPAEGLLTGGIVRQTAQRIVGNVRDPKAQARAIYNWVVATTWRDAKVAGCGTGDIATMLRKSSFGGKCVDINSLMVGLCRSVGLPAREVYGIRLNDSKLFKSLGRSGEVTGAQHCRAEIYLDQEGWLPVDPADVRKAVLEEKLPVDNPQIVALADRLFGNWESNWAGYNSATGIRLAGATETPNFRFLMYPCAMSNGTVVNCLDAPKFAYKIISREVTA
jgi:transglutaminase-like putative cysteine protease